MVYIHRDPKIVNRDPVTGRNLPKDLAGTRIGSVTVISMAEGKEHTYQNWLARCDCGNEFVNGSYKFSNAIKDEKNLTCKSCAPTGRPRIADNGAHVNYAFARYIKGAQARNIDFFISKEEFRKLIESDCKYCGVAPEAKKTHVNLTGEYNWTGVDRVDNSKGYTLENSVPCCHRCNFAKADRDVDEFLEWASRIYLHQQKSRQ